MTTAIYLDRNDRGDYEDVTVGPYFKTLDGDVTALVVGLRNGGSTAVSLTPSALRALRGGIDDVLRGGR